MVDNSLKYVLKNQVANKILQDILEIDPLALVAWGACYFAHLGEPEERIENVQGGVVFSVSRKKYNSKVVIYLMANNTYTVHLLEFVETMKPVIRNSIEDVIPDSIVKVIDEMISG